MFSEIVELLIQFFITDEIIQISQIFFCAPVIFYELKKIIIHLLIALLKILIFFLLFDNFFIFSEYSCAATPQIRQTGNRLSGLAETAYASLLAQCFV